MIRRPRSPPALWKRLLWVIAWGAVWGLVVTERILELHEGPPRTALVSAVFLLIFGSSSWVARKLGRGPLVFVPLLLLAGIAGREGYRCALRRQYSASAPVREVRPQASLWHPITTTDIGVRYYATRSSKLLVDRLRVVLASDLHVTPALPRAYYDHVFELISTRDADLILLAGDYASREDHIELLTQLFASRLRARFGVFAILGNHDYWTSAARIRETLSAAGVTFVENRCQRLPPQVGPVAICGTEAPWGPALSAALDRAELNLVLSHTPDNVYRLAEQGASLVFAGHTHGGQMRLPGVGSTVVPSRFGRLFDQGHFQVDGTDLFVSAGVGADAPPLRLYCQPEILVVDIARE